MEGSSAWQIESPVHLPHKSRARWIELDTDKYLTLSIYTVQRMRGPGPGQVLY